MSATLNLKTQIDLPVFEWMRPIPAATTAISSMTTANTLSARYIYYIVSSAFYRYDTYTDSWQQLANPVITPATLTEMGYSSIEGHNGRIIAGTANTVELAGLYGSALVGYTIRITDGKGMGQTRTITAVSKPIVKERGIVTTASTSVVIDASTGVLIKQLQVNKYRDHQVRIDYGGGVNQIRRILSHNYNSLVLYDSNWSAVTPWWGALLPVTTSATAATQTLYQIESLIATVDSNWDIIPDETSQFRVLSGGIWLTSSLAAAPFFSLQYYDVLADVWHQKSTQSNLFTAAVGTDASFEHFTTAGGAITSGVVLTADLHSVTVSGSGLEANRWNNLEIRITSGVGMGQTHTILANTTGVIFPQKPWDIIPTGGSTFSIYRDCGKLMLVGGAQAAMFQYSRVSDQWTTSKQLEDGTVRNPSVLMTGFEPLAITSIVRTNSGITSLRSSPNVSGLGYLTDQILTIGGLNATARVTGVSLSGAVIGVSLETPGTGYTIAAGRATVVSPAGGTGCTLEVLATGNIAYATTAVNHHFKIGNYVWISGVIESEYNGGKIVLGTNAATGFFFALTGTPATPATYVAQNATGLIDMNKSWAINEHSGKIVQISTVAPSATGQARRILSNTANTLTFATATTPTNGLSRYVICAPRAFGTEESVGSKTSNGRRDGFASAGTLSSLTDSTKSWPANYWSNTFPAGASNTGRKVRIVSGTGEGNEMTITANTSDTLYYALQSFTPDTTTIYEILDNFGVATGGSTTTLVDTTQNWGTNIWVGKRVRFLTGTSQGNEYTITANTQTTLTFATGTAPDTTTAYAILESPTKGTGIHIDCVIASSDPNLNNKYLYIWRGGATADLMRYNFVTEQIELLSYFPFTETLTTGSMYVYDGEDRIYFTKEATGRIMYYDVVKNIVVPSATIPFGMGAALIGNRMEIVGTQDGLKILYIARHTGQEFWRTLLFW